MFAALSPDGCAKVRPQRSHAAFFFFSCMLLRWASTWCLFRARWLGSLAGHWGHCFWFSGDMGQRRKWADIRHLKEKFFLHQRQE